MKRDYRATMAGKEAESMFRNNRTTLSSQPSYLQISAQKNSAEVNIKEIPGGISIPRLTFEEWSNATAPVLNASVLTRSGSNELFSAIHKNTRHLR